jgi:hypothetical protein
MIRRAIERRQLTLDHRRLSLADRRRLTRERDEADQLLKQQRQILSDLQTLAGPMADSENPAAQPAASQGGDDRPGTSGSATAGSGSRRDVRDEYHELLRAYVMMGSGNLGTEIARVAEHLIDAGLNPREALELHLEQVELLARGLGSRSTRHVLARADLMALELMIHIAECTSRFHETFDRSRLRRVSGDGIDLSEY